MPASKTVCSHQIKRMAATLADPQRRWTQALSDGTTLSPGAKGARKEVGEALMRWAANDEHAIAIATRILESREFVPTPLDIRKAAEEVAPPSKLKPADPDCPTCHGSGFRVETIAQTAGTFAGEYTGAGICPCRKKAQVAA